MRLRSQTTLIGIAIDQGLLAGVDVPVVEILGDAAPDVADDRKAAMTVDDLLTMSTGLDCRDVGHGVRRAGAVRAARVRWVRVARQPGRDICRLG